MADEEKNNLGEIDDWLADLDEEPDKDGGGAEEAAAPEGEAPEGSETGELNQDDIDSLLGGGEEKAAEEPAASEEGSIELDQSDIDSLFGDAGAGAEGGESPPPAEEEAGEELGQSAVDELLATGEESGEAQGEELAQSDIDDLFASGEGEAEESPSAEPVATEEGEAVSPEEVDQLFAGVDEEATVATAGPEPPREEAAAGGDFDADAFAFDDDSIPDIPDETEAEAAPAAEPSAEEIFADEGTVQELSELLSEGEEETKGKMPFTFPDWLNKQVAASVVVGLLILAGGGYYFLTRDHGPPEEQAPVPPPMAARVEEPAPAPEPPPQVNTPPQAEDLEVAMGEKAAAPVLLTAKDPDKDPVRFIIVRPPQHGRLSGDAPHLTYLAGQDFPGEDSFEYQASDGSNVSPPATVKITGPNLVAKKEQEAAKPKKVAARRVRPVVRARSLTLETVSTEPLTIDWKKVWEQANRNRYSSKVKVEILSGPSKGKLAGLDPRRHRYLPDPYFAGTDTIEYRFRYAGKASRPQRLTIDVKPGDPPPLVRIKPLEERYQVGERVVIDASQTLDDDPASLAFDWRQVAGVPVELRPLNDEGSVVSLVVPSFFSSLKNPDPVIEVTAIDISGQRQSARVRIRAESKRRTALWRGVDGSVAPEPDCPRGECPGSLLPWPYPD